MAQVDFTLMFDAREGIYLGNFKRQNKDPKVAKALKEDELFGWWSAYNKWAKPQRTKNWGKSLKKPAVTAIKKGTQKAPKHIQKKAKRSTKRSTKNFK